MKSIKTKIFAAIAAAFCLVSQSHAWVVNGEEFRYLTYSNCIGQAGHIGEQQEWFDANCQRVMVFPPGTKPNDIRNVRNSDGATINYYDQSVYRVVVQNN